MYAGSAILLSLLSASATSALPIRRAASPAVQLQNAKDAQALNSKFATLTASSSCTNDEAACVNGAFSQCVDGKFTAGAQCAAGEICAAVPLLNDAGTSVICDTKADAIARIQAAGASASLTTGSVNKRAASAEVQAQNAKDAQALNAKFATLSASSSCTDGEDGCVNGNFAQCVGGKFVVSTQCAGGETCVAVPLVNSPGTSTICDTESDALARIQAAGGSASLTGDGSASSSSSSGSSSGSSTNTPAAASSGSGSSSSTGSTTSSSSSSSNFQLANAQDAQALNAKFATLTASSSCTNDETACVDGKVSQCVNGKFEVGSSCSGGTQCVALPLVNSRGTTTTCDTEADAVARMQAAGASASLTGSASSGSASSSGNTPAAASSTGSAGDDSGDDCEDGEDGSDSSSTPAAASGSAGSATGSTTSSSSSSSDFQLANAQDAQALNKQFQSLTASSSCQNDETACVGGAVAQCVNGKFEVGSSCSGGTQCVALPLVNSRGTSTTCDTQADAIARMQAAGASASLTG